jgi:hypothetical protein
VTVGLPRQGYFESGLGEDWGGGGRTFDWPCWSRLLRSAVYAGLLGFFTMLRWSFGVWFFLDTVVSSFHGHP